MKNKKGVSTLIVIIAILILGLIAGGVAYIIGFGKAPLGNTSSKVEGLTDEQVIEKELNDTQLESIDNDLKDVDQAAISY